MSRARAKMESSEKRRLNPSILTQIRQDYFFNFDYSLIQQIFTAHCDGGCSWCWESNEEQKKAEVPALWGFQQVEELH